MLKSAIKRGSLTLSKQLGLSARVGMSNWRRQRLLVLCYHGISLSDEHEWNPALYITPQRLEHRLDLLRQHRCTVLTLNDAVERLYRNDLPERAVVLTFDDGYFDFLGCALPLLRAFGYPATVYLTTMRCEHNFPIVNLFVSYILWRCRSRALDGTDVPGLGAGEFPLSTVAQRAWVVDSIDAELKRQKLGRPEKDKVAGLVAHRLGLNYEELARSRVLTLMNSTEVADVSRRGVDIELHTHRHTIPEDPRLFRDEIVQNRTRIQAMTGKRPRHFCYPSGCYFPSSLPVLASEGVVTATTCAPGLVSRSTNPLLWPRFIDTMRVSDLEFEAWLTGPASWLARTPSVLPA
jgi:peptidoglycan/xylan/chitin deacetylase (PgdA/CDA1 family)